MSNKTPEEWARQILLRLSRSSTPCLNYNLVDDIKAIKQEAIDSVTQPPHPSGFKSDKELRKIGNSIVWLYKFSADTTIEQALTTLRALEQSGFERGHAKGVAEGLQMAAEICFLKVFNSITAMDAVNGVTQSILSLRDQKLKEQSQ